MKPDIKLEWGSPKHIELVRNFDKRMRGKMPLLLKTSVDWCIPICKPNVHGTWYFERTGGRVTHSMHCVACCPQCNQDIELVWSKKYNDGDWHTCRKCDIDFELREERLDYYPWVKYNVYLQKEAKP